MPSKHIPQSEARRLKKRVEELEKEARTRLDQYARQYPGGVNIETIDLNNDQWIRLDTVTRLGHPMVAKVDGRFLLIYAVKP